jgi:AcrR family transcriptional regulator
VPSTGTHRELIAAGYAALIEHGYSELSMRKIAAESDRSHSLFQHYHDDKRGVIVELLSYLIDAYIEDVTATSDGNPDPAGRLRADVERSLFGPTGEDEVQFWAFQTALFELRLVAREEPALREQFERGEGRVVDRFADSVRAGIEAGVSRPVDAKGVARGLRDLVDAARFRRVIMDESDAPQRTQ